jgi:membrane protease YdiL (CAAX protease family)
MMKSASARKVLVYLALTFALSIPFYYYIISSGEVEVGGGIYIIGLMWCPGLAALFTRLLFQRNLQGVGWRWGKTRYQVWGYLLPLMAILVVYGITWATGLGGFSGAELTGDTGSSLLIAIAMKVTVDFLLLVIIVLGEELGWRGLLVPELAKTSSFLHLSLISGVIWVIYHLPLLFFADYHSAAPKWYVFLIFTVLVVALSFIYAWLRLKSGSIWPGVLLHASHNLFTGVFDQLTVDRGYTEYITTEFGAGLAIVYVLVAYWCWTRRGSLPQVVTGEPELVAPIGAQVTHP